MTTHDALDDADDYKVIDAMAQFGGNFVQALADAWWHADVPNQRRIKATWPEYWVEFRKYVR